MKAGFDFTAISTPFYCIDGQGNILLHLRSDNCRDEQGTWDCGSGRLGFAEDPRQGVLREVREEYGCQGEILEQLEYYSIVRLHNGQTTHWIALPFIIKIKREEAVNNEPDKIERIQWFEINKLPEPLHQGFSFGVNKYKSKILKYS